MPVHAKDLHYQKNDVMMLCADGVCMGSCKSEKNLSKPYSEISGSNKTPIENASHSYTPAQ